MKAVIVVQQNKKMSAQSKKRSKGMTPEDKKKAGLKGLAKVLFSQLVTHTSLQEWGDSCAENSTKAIGLFLSIYRGDGVGMNTHLLHPLLLDIPVDVKRDERGALVRLKDSTGRVKGKSLEKLQISTYALLHGYNEIILESHEEEDVDADVLLMPQTIQFTELGSPVKKDHHEVAVELYSFGNKMRVFTSPAKIKELLTLTYLDSTNIKGVLLALNNLLEKEAFKLDITSLTELGSLQTLLQECEKPSQAKFFQTLIAAKVEGSKAEERVGAFIKNPSAEFARILQFKKPYSAPLFERGTGGRSERIPLSTLGDDDEVLLSTVTVDTKFYEAVRSDIGSLLVYKRTANIGIKKNKKWVELKTSGSMKVQLFTKMLEAIAADNKGQTTVAFAKTSTSMEDDSEDELDDLNF
jgi:hypothetical protein